MQRNRKMQKQMNQIELMQKSIKKTMTKLNEGIEIIQQMEKMIDDENSWEAQKHQDQMLQDHLDEQLKGYEEYENNKGKVINFSIFGHCNEITQEVESHKAKWIRKWVEKYYHPDADDECSDICYLKAEADQEYYYQHGLVHELAEGYDTEPYFMNDESYYI